MDSHVNKINANMLPVNDLVGICEKISCGELVLVPSETNWLIIGDPKNIIVKQNIKKLLHLPDDICWSYLCLGKYDSKEMCTFNDIEEEIFDYLVGHFWPKPLAIYAKKSNIIVKTTKFKILKDIVYEFGGPLLVHTANVYGKPKNNSLQQILANFENKDINILDKDYVSEKGLDDTIVKIDNNTTTLYKQGYISSKIIEQYLKLKEYAYVGDAIYKVPNEHKFKNIYNMCILDISELTDVIPDEIINKTKKMLGNTILIDYNKINKKYKNHFLGYVDISETGDVQEVLFNFYNILHQIIDGKYDKVFVSNFKYIADDPHINVFWEMLSNISYIDKKTIGIPKQIIDKM